MDNFLDETREPEPCPKCGANPYSWEPKPGMVGVRCAACGFNGPLEKTHPQAREFEAEDAAVREWNRLSYSEDDQTKHIVIYKNPDGSVKAEAGKGAVHSIPEGTKLLQAFDLDQPRDLFTVRTAVRLAVKEADAMGVNVYKHLFHRLHGHKLGAEVEPLPTPPIPTTKQELESRLHMLEQMDLNS